MFDLDGTVVDAFADIAAAANHGLAAHGLPTHDLSTITGFVGNGLSKLVERALPPGAADRHADVLAATLAYYRDHPADLARVYDGMPEAIAELRADGFRTAILSNKADILVQRIVEALGLAHLFDAVVGERPGEHIKPDPTALLALARRLGAAKTAMIGDGRPDMEVARNAGAAFVGVLWGLGSEEKFAGCPILARAPADVPACVRRACA